MRMKGIGERIGRQRKKLNLSREELGERINVSTNTIANYELDRREPPFDTLIKLAYALEVTPNDLLGVNETAASVYRELRELLREAGYEIEEKSDGELRIITPRVLIEWDDKGIAYFAHTPQFAANFPASEIREHIIDLLKLAATPYTELSNKRLLAAINEFHLPMVIAKERHTELNPSKDEWDKSVIQPKKKK